jgi:hypothetical protein
MPSLDTERELNTDLPGMAVDVASTNGNAEVGCATILMAPTKQWNGMDNPAPASADGAKPGAVEQSSIEYWFFCGDGVWCARGSR